MSYSDGTHNSPADTKDRLVRIGTKYQAALAAVADGDNVYLAVSSLGEVKIDYLTTDVNLTLDGQTPGRGAAVAALVYLKAPDNSKDHARSLGDTAGSGLGVIAAARWVPGASDVKTITVTIGATSASRNTALTPNSGKKVRIISIDVAGKLTTAPDRGGVYFGAGAAYTTNPASAIAQGYLGTTGDFSRTWPDGGGPVGAVDEVLS
jgi:hypothetical protein